MTPHPAHIAGRSVDGRPILAERFGDTGPTCLVVCGIHGNEASSVAFGERLRSRLRRGWAEAHGVRLVLVQVANPDGVAAGTRFNARGVDINRNFPAANFEADGERGPEPESEPETRALRGLVDTCDPEAILAIHCCEPLFDWDGPARPFAEAMSDRMPEAFRFPVEKLGPNPGSLGSWAGVDRDLPVLTVEFDCHGPTDIRRQLDAVEESVDAALEIVADTDSPQQLSRSWRAGGVFRPAGSPELVSRRFQPPVSPSPDIDYRALRNRYADRTIRLETRDGRRDRPPILLLGAADERPARHLFESLRRRLLHRRSLETPVAIASPVTPDSTESASPPMPEPALSELLDDVDPRTVVAVESGDSDGYWSHGLEGVDVEVDSSDLTEITSPRSDELTAECGSRNLPLLGLSVFSDHAEGRHADDVPSPARFYALLERILDTHG